MSVTMSTPQRPLPGAYMATPAASRFPPPATRPNDSQEPAPKPQPVLPELSAIERAKNTINDSLELQRTKYPELETYIQQGISSEYVVASNTAPFQKVKSFPIPEQVLEHVEHTALSIHMGLFAEFNLAWVSLDNALYLWEYMHPDPEIIGFEDQPHAITEVRMVKPRAGVFIPAITRVLVVATTTEVILVGFSAERLPHGGRKIELYQTKMSVNVKGLDVGAIAGDDKTGRIFFSGSDNDVYEFHYQQEEKWFYNRCWKINHTSSRLATLKPSLKAFNFTQSTSIERAMQMVVDQSRQLLYTLSTTSTIRVFHIKTNGELSLVVTKTIRDTLGNIAHMVQQTELLSAETAIVAISPVPSYESQRLNLVATTSTGCRIIMSATSPTYWQKEPAAPTSMQVHHVRFPPSDPRNTNPGQTSSTAVTTQVVDTASRLLTFTQHATRYSPGYFFDAFKSDPSAKYNDMFLSVPDAGQLARSVEQQQPCKFIENGMWLALDGDCKDIGLVTEPFAAAATPQGFGNELAVQHDKATAEVAVLTHFGITTLRRVRLVDEFASAVRLGKAEDGLELSVKNFIRLYGRSETSASALAVACGQGLDVTNDLRVASITDPDILDAARTAFIEYGGRPHLNENSLLDQSAPAIDLVKPSPRHDGLALYVSRIIRSLWRSTITTEAITPTKGLTVISTIHSEKLQDVQQDLTKLQEFLAKNKSFIDGLGGPEALSRAGTKQEEIALQAEHRALHALVTLITNIIEGISFVQMLFSERIEEIVLTLTPDAREQLKQMTYEDLFCTLGGRSLAKDLVKAIVNRNIQQGHNVDTVADSLRRRCGSFCSAADVIIFKAQEQQKRASEKGSNTELGRNLLNESLRLFKQVVDSLTLSQLQDAVSQYVSMQFYAGAIELALLLAHEKDRANRALAWIEAGRPEQVCLTCPRRTG
jgi:nuclear pore complex protein Nup155